jgi:hypothetical protein
VAVLREKVVRRRPRRRRVFELNADEQLQVKRALRVLRVRFGGWEVLAAKLGCNVDTLQKAAGNGTGKNAQPSAGLALRVAQAAAAPVEDMITGAWLKDIPCPLCGRTG